MKKFWLIFAQTTTIGLALVFVLLSTRPYWQPIVHSPARPASTPAALPLAPYTSTTFRYAAQQATPSVVNIYTAQKTARHRALERPLLRHYRGNLPEQPVSTLGSGVIVHKDGYIITNRHVIRAAEQIEVALSDGRTAEAELIGTDAETDLAVIKIDLPDLPEIHFGEIKQLQVGDVVLAIGNPFGFGQTVTMGIISALERTGLNTGNFENFIQTDAAINPGNSGGALVNQAGHLIGINSAILSETGSYMGIGFATPVNTVRRIMEEIIRTGTVTRGWIGIQGQNITPEMAHAMQINVQEGVLITRVVKGQPADKSGVRTGDILTAIGQKQIPTMQAMYTTVSELTPGTPLKVSIVRKNTELTVDMIVGQRPNPKP